MFPKTHCLLVFYKTYKTNDKEIFEIVKRLQRMPTETKLLSVISDLPMGEEQFMNISVNTLIFQTKIGILEVILYYIFIWYFMVLNNFACRSTIIINICVSSYWDTIYNNSERIMYCKILASLRKTTHGYCWRNLAIWP